MANDNPLPREPNPQLKNAMIDAMVVHFGVVTTAAKSINISRAVHYQWLENDPEYKQSIFDLKEIKKDFVESKLLKLVNDGDTAATIFSAKTLLKDRGYVERTEVDHSGEAIIRVIRDANI